MLLTHGYIR